MVKPNGPGAALSTTPVSSNPAALEAGRQLPVTIIRPTSGWVFLNLGELWNYRDLLWILAERDIKLRYKQTAIGVAWVILQPLIAAVIFTVIFGRLAKLPSDNQPYILFVFAGLLPWNYFSGALQRAGSSLVGNANLITKVYFPRLIIPISSTLAVLLDFAVALAVMLALMVFYQTPLTWNLAALPYFLFLATLTAVGISLWISALNVRYRDFMYALPFLIQVWMYASPVAYAASLIPARWRWLYSLNPAAGFIEGFRWSLLGSSSLTLEMVVISTAVAVVSFISGAFFFRRVERSFADVV